MFDVGVEVYGIVNTDARGDPAKWSVESEDLSLGPVEDVRGETPMCSCLAVQSQFKLVKDFERRKKDAIGGR